MKTEDFNHFVDGMLKQIKDMTYKGQAEYAHGIEDNVFNNFNRVAGQVEVDRRKVLWTYLSKHLDGITSHIKGNISQREHVSGRITDAIVYLVILNAMIMEDESTLPVQNTFTGSVGQVYGSNLVEMPVMRRG